MSSSNKTLLSTAIPKSSSLLGLSKAGSFIFILTLLYGGRYHTETSPLICSAYQWTGFYMITASVMKELTGLYGEKKTRG